MKYRFALVVVAWLIVGATVRAADPPSAVAVAWAWELETSRAKAQPAVAPAPTPVAVPAAPVPRADVKPPGALLTTEGTWIVPNPNGPGYVPLADYKPTRSGVVSGVTTPRPFSGPGSTAPSTPGTPAPSATTSRPPTGGGVPLRTTAPSASRAATPTAPTTTSAPGAAPPGGSLAGSIEIGSGKLIVADWYDAQGNHFIRYADGSTKVCSAYG